MVFRHRDERIWPQTIIFDQGTVEFDLRKIDHDLPEFRISLKVGEIQMTLRRTKVEEKPPEPAKRGYQPRDPANRFEQAAARMIIQDPRGSEEAAEIRRRIAKVIHPERGPALEKEARTQALANVNAYLDQFKK